MRSILALCSAAVLWAPRPVEAQATGVWQGIQNGGGWVAIPIDHGTGSFEAVPLPTAGVTLSGCINVWAGHSGDWTIRARDNVTDSVLELRAKPGEGVRFTHTFGLRTQLDFDFEWSEPRDTTLVLWVGLGLGRETRADICEPKYGS